nr:hypothetical protein [Pseudomonas sp. TH41]
MSPSRASSLLHWPFTVSQVLENIAFRAEIGCDTVVLSDFSKLLAIPLRDGCDLMDVIGRRLRAQTAE